MTPLSASLPDPKTTITILTLYATPPYTSADIAKVLAYALPGTCGMYTARDVTVALNDAWNTPEFAEWKKRGKEDAEVKGVLEDFDRLGVEMTEEEWARHGAEK